MKVIIPGGSGQVGQALARRFTTDGFEVVSLSRNTRPVQTGRVVLWDAETLGDWSSEFERADVIINLAGRSVNCRYTSENRKLILESRVKSTRVVGEAIAQCSSPPLVWLQAATATIYAHRYDAPNDDYTGIIGGNEPNVPETWRFSIDVARAWERELEVANVPRTRKVALRSAMVMSIDKGGIFDTLLGLVRKGLGGTSGKGKQYLSWIHELDFYRAIRFLMEHDLTGAVNVSSPNPLPNAEFMRILRKAWGMPIGLPATEWMLAIGARMMGTETELVLKSRRVVPSRLTDAGFKFEFPGWNGAADQLCAEYRAPHVAKVN